MSDTSQGPGWWVASDGRWYPPEQAHGAAPPPPYYATPHGYALQPIQAANGMAVAALTLGIIGAIFGLIPILFFIAVPCGILALIFGLIARGKASRGAARKGMATSGVVLGVIATALGIAGVVIVNNAVDDVDDCFEAIDDDIRTGGDSADDACD